VATYRNNYSPKDLHRELVGVRIVDGDENSTPLSISVAMKARLRDSRSSLAMTSFALCRIRIALSLPRRWRPALAGLGLDESPEQLGVAVDEGKHGRPLRVEPKAGFALPIGADPEIPDETAN
jgi:hypothetical protein